MKKLIAILTLGVAALFSKEVYAQSITLGWDASPDAVSSVTTSNGVYAVSSSVDRYIVRSVLGGVTNTVTVPVANTTAVVTNIQKGVTYNFSVVAASGADESDPATLVWFSPFQLTTFSRPALDIVINTSTWNVEVFPPVVNRSQLGFVNWTISIQNTEGGGITNVTTATASHNFIGLPRGSYKFWVSATNIWGTNTFNSASYAYVSQTKPVTVKGVRVQ